MAEVLEKIETITIKLRLAVPKDFNKEMSVEDNGRIILKKLPKIGQPFWIRSEISNTFDPIHYQISEHTDWTEFKEYLRRGMVYVPQTFTDLKKQ